MKRVYNKVVLSAEETVGLTDKEIKELKRKKALKRAQQNYNKSQKGKARIKKYKTNKLRDPSYEEWLSDRKKIYMKTYNKSIEGKAARKAYRKTPKGKAAYFKYLEANPEYRIKVGNVFKKKNRKAIQDERGLIEDYARNAPEIEVGDE